MDAGKKTNTGEGKPKKTKENRSKIDYLHHLIDFFERIFPPSKPPETYWGRFWPCWGGALIATTAQVGTHGREAVQRIYVDLGPYTAGPFLLIAILISGTFFGVLIATNETWNSIQRFYRGILIVMLTYYTTAAFH